MVPRAPLLGVEWEPSPPARRDASKPGGPLRGAFWPLPLRIIARLRGRRSSCSPSSECDEARQGGGDQLLPVISDRLHAEFLDQEGDD